MFSLHIISPYYTCNLLLYGNPKYDDYTCWKMMNLQYLTSLTLIGLIDRFFFYGLVIRILILFPVCMTTVLLLTFYVCRRGVFLSPVIIASLGDVKTGVGVLV